MPKGVYDRRMAKRAPLRPLAGRLWSRVEKTDSCWLWHGSCGLNGYGMITQTRDGVTKRWMVHRLAYELVRGVIPEGLELDHLCRTVNCVNPAHLEPVTHQENCLRGVSLAAENAQKTHCKRGHEFTPENTYIQMYRGRPRRKCRACHAARQNARYWADPEKYRAWQREYEARKAIA